MAVSANGSTNRVDLHAAGVSDVIAVDLSSVGGGGWLGLGLTRARVRVLSLNAWIYSLPGRTGGNHGSCHSSMD